jgi:hypothetical protein
VERVIMIQHLFAAGLCSVTIVELLPCLEAPEHERTEVMGQLLDEAVTRLETKRRDVERELAVLDALRRDTATAQSSRAPS